MFEEVVLLRIYISESDRHNGKPLYQWLLEQGRNSGFAGGTVLRGLEGFGAHHTMRTAKFIDLSTDLPLVLEFVDKQENIDKMIAILDDNLKEGMATCQNVKRKLYRKK